MKCINNIKKAKYNVPLLLNEEQTLVTEDIEKSEVLNTFFVLVFTDHSSPQESLTWETRVKEGGRVSLGAEQLGWRTSRQA